MPLNFTGILHLANGKMICPICWNKLTEDSNESKVVKNEKEEEPAEMIVEQTEKKKESVVEVEEEPADNMFWS